MTDAPPNVTRLDRRIIAAATTIAEVDCDQPEFLHATLCQLGMPRSRIEERSFTRSCGAASMRLEAGSVAIGQGKWRDMPLPYGSKPRLVMFNICAEITRTRSPYVDLGGSMRRFLERLGLEHGGNQLAMFKKQMTALSVMRMSLSYESEQKITQVNTQPIEAFEAWLPVDGRQGTLWPDQLCVSQTFMKTVLDHSVPLDPRALCALRGSALALDVYTWLAHRLCRLRTDGGAPLYWKNLRDQFGQEYTSDRNFKKEFVKALHQAKAVYPDARIEEIRGGLRLFPSPPPVKKTSAVVSLPVKNKPAALTSVDQIRLQDETLAQVRDLAPGWDKYYLEQEWRHWIATKAGMPHAPDKAFLGWVKSFTKGKAPRD